MHILHARQFDAGNVQDVLQTAKAGHLNDGMAAYDRIFDGLASGDLQVISISDGLSPSNTHAHCLLPYRCETLASGERDLYVWDSMRPYALYPDYYNSGYNRIRINGPTDWTYNQNYILNPTQPSTTDTSTKVSTTAGCSPSPPPPSATRGASPSASATSCRISPTSC